MKFGGKAEAQKKVLTDTAIASQDLPIHLAIEGGQAVHRLNFPLSLLRSSLSEILAPSKTAEG